MYICICRKHSEHCSGKTPCIQGRKSPSSGSRVIGKRLGESLYNYVAAWTLSSSVALVGLYMIIMQSSQHRYSTVSMLSGSSVYVVSAVPRRSVILSGLSSLSRQSIPSSLQAYFSLSSLGSSLREAIRDKPTLAWGHGYQSGSFLIWRHYRASKYTLACII